ncbi:type VII secretion-associated serine protease mycosin [Mycobacterium helveticum]|uniref:Type VII secretion-associated serine protease mycosin n=1 Tax=Mycobacterium helveticum TaxID=2592811 RepID=A0A557Y0G0_9MYCO|nr:type VII secretion-associated serine protease mycosin [Mycobacterium helveticum]TVS92044.1 type VII secretion-associated serine protease mycosin [Mycobacterium helveticum]
MQRSATADRKVWRGRATRATVAALLLTSGALAGLPPASAISPPTIDPAAVPPDGPPGPPAPMKQTAYCTEVGVLPGTDFKVPPQYMDMLNLPEAWQFGRGAGVKVAVIDTGVTPHPRLPRLIPGGDYIMGGDGLSDCDAHGTIVASMIGAAPTQASDAYSGIAPDVDIISIRQSSQAFGLKDAYTGDEDPQTRAKVDSVETMARAIVHAADMGAQVINISDVTCMSARNVVDQRSLGAAVRYAAVDKNVVIVAAAGDSSKKDCKQNPLFDPLQPNDPRDWNAVTTVVTPSWFSDYVLTVGAVNNDGRPLSQGGQGQGSSSIAGPWVGIAAPGTDVVGLSPRDDGLINAIDGPDNTLLVPSGTSFSTAIVSGVAALVRAKYPELSSHQIINRLTRTARAPARGVDNQVGYGVVDPVAALTWDVPEGPVKPPQQLSAPLNTPKPAPPRDEVPVWVAAGGLTGALLIGGAVFGVTMLMKRSRKQR